MGKKERDIKKLNNDFYKEYNNENIEHDIKNEEREFEQERLFLEKHERDDDAFNIVMHGIINEMREYTINQGLCLCENISTENVNNFMEFIMTQPSYRKPITRIVDNPPIDTRPCIEDIIKSTHDLNKEIKDIDEEIVRRRDEFIIENGEDMIFTDYIKINYNGEVPSDMNIQGTKDLLRKKLIKIAGSSDKYYKLVNSFGEAKYAYYEQKIGL